MDILSKIRPRLAGSAIQHPATVAIEVKNLLSIPSEILVQIFITLICDDENFTISVASLAATCKRLHAIFHGTRSIWTEMFAARYLLNILILADGDKANKSHSFDLLEHQKLAEFDIKQEYKSRRIALNYFTQVRPVDKVYLTRLVSENSTYSINRIVPVT